MKLKLLLPTTLDIDVLGITVHTDYLKPGFLLIITSFDSVTIIKSVAIAEKKKACFIISPLPISSVIPHLIFQDIYQITYTILARFYFNYSKIKLIGVTGTDGKTTTTTFLYYLLNHLKGCAYIGTNGIHYLNNHEESPFTTPLISTTYYYLDLFASNNLSYCAMEVSSEGILNKRITGLKYQYAIFTNLSHEHLNTHKTMENYFQTKYQLFKQLSPRGMAIINNDDIYSSRFCIRHSISYALDNKADYMIINIREHPNGTLFDLKTKHRLIKDFLINRYERYNLYNILPAIIVALKEGMAIKPLRTLLKSLPVVSGRLEEIKNDLGINIYIDFAHTPNAIDNVLSEVKKKTKGSLIHVMGATGEKDSSKRPLMGSIASKYADILLLTNEDPKNEDPKKIIKELLTNINTPKCKVIYSRKDAINYSLSIAKKDDTVIITGKGRENTYNEKGKIFAYSDYEVVKAYLNRKDIPE